MKKILITGSGGQLGSELCRQLGELAVAIDVDRLDITSQPDVRRTISEIRPDCVVNTAAFTAVDKAEADRDRCFAVNSQAVEFLADATRELGARFVQISTDYVFGETTGHMVPWREIDEPSPMGVYARSKRSGEAAAARNPNYIIVRSCGLYGKTGPTATGNFVATMLRLGNGRTSIRVVDDQHCTPTWVPELAVAIRFLIQQETETGIFHVTNRGATTWFEFAQEIFRLAGIKCLAEPITSMEYGSPVPRPPYSVLNISKYEQLGGPNMSTWQDALKKHLHSI